MTGLKTLPVCISIIRNLRPAARINPKRNKKEKML